jgi:2-keto-4-pentenoate hydratase/2-oxohepta-3-ene-1,7-dioic acid hydratase in catechol pathway
MKLASFTLPSGSSWGHVSDAGVIDLGRRLPRWPSIRAMLEGDGLDSVRALTASLKETDLQLSDITLEPVIVEPRKILCIGVNYETHRMEVKRERLGYPTVFARFPDSQTAHNAPMILPQESETFDFEGELAVIIGTKCRRVSPAEAYSVIAGYSCYNDGSIREYQRHTSQWHPGKNFPRTGAFGPYLVTSDEVGDISKLVLETRLNGETVQHAGLDQLIFTIPELISYCSAWTQLSPGDVIVTGTPGGVGSARTPPLWLKEGDKVEVEVSGIGVLRNTIVLESLALASLRTV